MESTMNSHPLKSTAPIAIKKTFAEKKKSHPKADSLGFGKYFTDHMLTIQYKNGNWQTPEIGPYQALQLDPAASVLHYGQALFEGMKAFRQENGKIALFRPDYNWQRLNQGAQRLCMPMIPNEVFMESLKELIRVEASWVPSEPECSLYIRPTLIGTEPFLGVRPSEEYLFFVILSPVGSYYGQGMQQGVKIWVEEDFVRAAPGGLGATKAAANYANSLYAAHSAKKNGYAQVLWLDVNREYVEEVGTMNVFFVMEDCIVTPPLGGTILAGGVRDSVIQLLTEWKLPLVTKPIKINELSEAAKTGRLKEVFGTGTAAVITAVDELHRKSGEKIMLPQKGMGPLSKKLFDALSSIQRGLQADTHQWIVTI